MISVLLNSVFYWYKFLVIFQLQYFFIFQPFDLDKKALMRRNYKKTPQTYSQVSKFGLQYGSTVL